MFIWPFYDINFSSITVLIKLNIKSVQVLYNSDMIVTFITPWTILLVNINQEDVYIYHGLVLNMLTYMKKKKKCTISTFCKKEK